jgi:hypothetical protein
VTLYLPSNPARYENSVQERSNERKAERKQIERLLAMLAKKMGTDGKAGKPNSTRIA